MEKITLNDVYNTYKKWLHIADDKRIDIGLTVALSRKMRGTKLWLIIVGPSGDWKSEQINALNDDASCVRLRRFTPYTLISGNKRVEDLAPKLDNKILLLADLGQILKLNPNDKAMVWTQLRDLYDGFAMASFGTGKKAEYEGLNVTLIAGATPAIDSQILIHQDLGTRELLWRTNPEDNKAETMKKVWENEKSEEIMRLELNNVTTEFIRQKEAEIDKKINYGIYADKKDIDQIIPIPPEVQEQLMMFADYLPLMRATAEIDSFTGELIANVNPEEPTRVLKQFKRLYRCLKCLDDNYPDERAIDVIRHIVHSCSYQNRNNVLTYMLKQDTKKVYTIHNTAKDLAIGRKTIFKEMNVLKNLGFLEDLTETVEIYGREQTYFKWKLNLKNKVILDLLIDFGVEINVENEKEGD